MSERIVYVYGMVDPRGRSVRYVGSSVAPGVRLQSHCSQARKLPVPSAARRLVDWIRALDNEGVAPLLVLLEATTVDAVEQAESWWIAMLSDHAVLCNHPGHTGRSRCPTSVEDHKGLRATNAKLPPLYVTSDGAVDAIVLRGVRERHGYSQRALARSLGVSNSTISLWEAGKRPIPRHIALALKSLTD